MTTNGRPGYGDATAHYLSARRRDPVKVLMEEVATHRVLSRAVAALDLAPGAPLTVLDLGAGTGDGLALLTERHGEPAAPAAGHPLRYTGLDADPGMVATAQQLRPEARFVQGDMRDAGDPERFGGTDLYLSCGVPWSHLDPDAARTALAGILAAAARRATAARPRRTAIVVDVLGRYSVEWTPNWGRTRWNYAMSFFEDVDATVEEIMHTYDRPGLDALIHQAADAARLPALGVPFAVEYADRSVLTGRHTATRALNPALPAPYRTLVNRLHRGEDIDPAELRHTPPTEGAPDDVLRFHAEFADGWNTLLATAAAGPEALARALLEHELKAPRGLGAGHSLSAVVLVRPGG
ncbi:hypothetical protein BIV57_08030 [Mangrovactinospora gilvigrisea]|uniref:Methyltransferase domain-containing protein n=1 Tax=Mangrovactinospora gilvigrisea TaxID=1428644 RepID=A0A1J7BH78_9ACTN|nr:class I SAM-dependent methyltransferase [Mangrovactinospora gilvigrisea]OIV38014.1 hypothetical protein BIV57_08030 [Mangrovactinospora gilvigrisea]